MKRKGQKTFWKLPSKLQIQKNDVSKNIISGKKWNEQFKRLLRLLEKLMTDSLVEWSWYDIEWDDSIKQSGHDIEWVIL